MKTLSLVIPVYNEAKRLKFSFKALNKGLGFSGTKIKEIIFVNDGSTDNTYNLLIQNKKLLEKSLNTNVLIVSYNKNRGKGYAVKKGMLRAKSEYALLTDCDFSTPLSEFKKFVPYIKSNCDVVIGTRKNGESSVLIHQPLYRELMGRAFTLVSKIILNLKVSDFTCGFKLFSKNSIHKIFSKAKIERWAYDSEILFLAKKRGYFINEVAVTWNNKKGTKVKIIKSAIESLRDLVKIRYFDISGSYSYKKYSKRKDFEEALA